MVIGLFFYTSPPSPLQPVHRANRRVYRLERGCRREGAAPPLATHSGMGERGEASIPLWFDKLTMSGYKLTMSGYKLTMSGYKLIMSGYKLIMSGYKLTMSGYKLTMSGC